MDVVDLEEYVASGADTKELQAEIMMSMMKEGGMITDMDQEPEDWEPEVREGGWRGGSGFSDGGRVLEGWGSGVSCEDVYRYESGARRLGARGEGEGGGRWGLGFSDGGRVLEGWGSGVSCEDVYRYESGARRLGARGEGEGGGGGV